MDSIIDKLEAKETFVGVFGENVNKTCSVTFKKGQRWYFVQRDDGSYYIERDNVIVNVDKDFIQERFKENMRTGRFKNGN